MATPPTDVTACDLVRTIVREHRDGLVSYAERMLGDRGLAEDIVQETIIRAWRNTDRLLGMEGSVKGWLFTVTRNLVIDWVRKPHTRKEVVGGTYIDPSSGAESFEAVHHSMVAKPTLRRLSPEHREVLIHLYLRDRTIKETAAILGIPAGTVKSRQHNALRKLRQVLPPEAVA
ncbi:sigma-70 family RNA polymerase sigma factor [Streptomyces sp. NPDC051362]|uniref:sigma-70 family RNA polymerase sigma factor n=1 Tax=Streptomyces sp. NPDC051362 TaxID=3365651 RepID=UPI0037B1B379